MKKPSRSTRAETDSPYFIGMSMGGTKLYIALYRRGTGGVPKELAAINVIWKDLFHLRDPRDVADPAKVSGDDIVREAARAILNLLKEEGLEVRDLNNVGCTAPGPLDHQEGIIGSACKTFNLPFNKYPFVRKLQEALGIPYVEIKHDSHSGLEGEIALGVLADVKNGYYAIQGTGFGGSPEKGGAYYAAIPELTEPGHHIIGTPVKGDEFTYHFRYIMKGGKDHPREVVETKDPRKSYEVTRGEAEAMIARGGSARDDFIWSCDGERDLEDVVAGVALEPMLKDKERLVRQFGGCASDYSRLNQPKDLSERALKGDVKERAIAARIIRSIAEEMGKGLAALIAASYGTEWQLERVVVGSAVGERLGLGLTTEDGEDFYFWHIRESAKRELEDYFRITHVFADPVSHQIVRSTLTQEVRETAGFDRAGGEGGTKQ